MAFPKLRNLKRLRGRITLEKIAGDLEISVSQLSRYETGERDPKLTDLRKLAAYLSTSVADLIGERTEANAGSTAAVPSLKDSDCIQVQVGFLRNLVAEALIEEGAAPREAHVYGDAVVELLATHQASNVVLRLGELPDPPASQAHAPADP